MAQRMQYVQRKLRPSSAETVLEKLSNRSTLLSYHERLSKSFSVGYSVQQKEACLHVEDASALLAV